jgi:RNA polymerase sigma-70 factor (ECF subfamily)
MPNDQTIALYQPMLHAIAYNLVRCREDAEDIVQETFLKWLTLGPQRVGNVKAYLVKAVINNCRNHLNTLRKKKEELFSQVNLSDIVNRFRESNFAHIDLEINIQAALRILQNKLEPLERAVYLLKEVFGFDYDTLQETLDKKKDHCRQLFLRAKNKLRSESAKVHVELPDTANLAAAFRKACYFGHADELLHALKTQIPPGK